MMVLRCREAHSFDVAGVPQTVRVGTLVAADHPWVVGRESMYETAEDASIAGPEPVLSAPAKRVTRTVTVTGK